MMTMADWSRFSNETNIGGRDEIWRASGGREIRIKDLTDEHLINILNWIETTKGQHVPNSEQATEKYFWLRLEAMRRGLRWREYQYMKLREGDLARREREAKYGIPIWSSLFGKRVKVALKVTPDSTEHHAYGYLESIELVDPKSPFDPNNWPKPTEIPSGPKLRNLRIGQRCYIKGKRRASVQRVRLYGQIAQGLISKGYDLQSWTGMARSHDDGVWRCAVMASNGVVYLEAADVEVEEITN